MDLSQITFTELKTENPDLADNVVKLLYRAQDLGVKDGLQRLTFAAQHFKKLSLEEAYHLINPYALQREIEEAQTRKYWVGSLNVLRNVFGVAPLILTWLALYFAVGGYQRDLFTYKDDAFRPFLRLWQDGFHHTTWFTFTIAALADVVLLGTYLLLNVLIPILETRAQNDADKFAEELRKVTDELTKVMAKAGNSSNDINQILGAIDDGGKQIMKAIKEGMEHLTQSLKAINEADVEKIVEIIKRVVNNTLMESQKVAKEAQEAIKQVTTEAKEAIQETNKSMAGVINPFQQELQVLNTNSSTLNGHLGTLNSNVQGYNGQIKELELANSKMAGATLSLAHNADDLKASLNLHTTSAQGISSQLGALNTTQQQMVTALGTTQQQVVEEIRSTQGKVVQEISTTQQQVVQGIASTQGQVVTEIRGAADNMERTAVATQAVATELGQITKEDIQKMTKSVVNAVNRIADTSEAMGQVQNSFLNADKQLHGTILQIDTQLQGTTKALLQASQELAKAAANLRRPPWWVRVWPRRRPETGPTGTPSRGV